MLNVATWSTPELIEAQKFLQVEIAKYAPEPEDFSAEWIPNPDEGPGRECPGCQDAADGSPYTNPYSVPDPTEVCYSMNGIGRADSECTCTIAINDGDDEVDAVDFDPTDYDVEKSLKPELVKGDTPGHEFHGNQYSGSFGTHEALTAHLKAEHGTPKKFKTFERAIQVHESHHRREIVEHTHTLTKGESEGHPFRGNRYTSGVADESDKPSSMQIHLQLRDESVRQQVAANELEKAQLVKVDPEKLLQVETGKRDRPSLTEKYRNHSPIAPVAINQQGVILDGHHRVRSAIAAGRKTIWALQMKDHVWDQPSVDDLKNYQGKGAQFDPINSTINALRPLPKERAVVINARGQKVWEKDGGHDFVALRELEHKDIEGATFLHNHPSGVALSVDDIGSACALRLSRVYAIGKTGYTYCVEPPKGKKTFDPSMWKKIRDTGKAADEATRAAFSFHLKKGSLESKDANIDHWHTVLQTIAAVTGIQYSRVGKGTFKLGEIKAAHHSHIPVYDKKGVSKGYPDSKALTQEADTTFRLLNQRQKEGTKPAKRITNADADTRR